MQMVKKSIIMVVFVWLAVIVLMPKKELYFKLEALLDQQGVKISGEKIQAGWFTLNVENLEIYVEGIKVATVKEASLFTLLAQSRISLEGIMLDSSLKQFAPQQTDEVVVGHSIFAPMRVWLEAKGDFGEGVGEALLDEKRLKMNFSQIEKLGMLRSQMKKGEEGWVYETSF